ncbi:MAG: hypothetical protein ACUVXA_11265 [Candidatus Jordarchaeum sp.]|uniref:hypothetical protein n=1 Tax=Candidatus Jordarchaeum sp. TaxID=2823881 RepID=UPI00404A6132
MAWTQTAKQDAAPMRVPNRRRSPLWKGVLTGWWHTHCFEGAESQKHESPDSSRGDCQPYVQEKVFLFN